MTNKYLFLLMLIMGIGLSPVSANPEYLILKTDITQTESVVKQLKSNPDIKEVRRLFGSELLAIKTERPEVLDATSVGQVYVDQVLDLASTRRWEAPDNVITDHSPAPKQPSALALRTAARSPLTNDPLNIFQWAYQNFGYDRGITGPAVADVDTGAHAINNGGAGITVAMVTTGADYTHEDLNGALWTNDQEIPNNSIDDDGNGFVDDVYGPGPHASGDTFDQFGDGTALAGIIAARNNNGIGITGIAPNAKVLACNATMSTGQFSVADLLICIDYVIFQKTVRNENIPIFIFTVGKFKPFDQIIEPALRALMDADIIVVAASFIEPKGYLGINLDHSTDTPSTADFPNIISVNAIDRAGQYPYSSGGQRVIDVAAPGIEILTTLPGYSAPQDSSSFLFEDFESKPSDWNLSGGWEYSATAGYENSGGLILTSGVGVYGDDSQIIELPAMDLSSLSGPRPWFSFKLWAENMTNKNPSEIKGKVDLEIWQGDIRGWWPIISNHEYMAGPAWQTIKGNLNDFQLTQVDLANIRLRFRAFLSGNHSPVIKIDDFGIGSQAPDPGYSNNYGYYNGTAPAAAIVGAMAAVIKSERPELSNIEVRNLLVGSGPSFTEIANNINPLHIPPPLPESRFPRLWTDDGRGALQCSGLLTQRRTVPPISQTFVRALGQPLLTRAISTDCENPGQPLQISSNMANNTVTLHDNGQIPDTRAFDGEFAGVWTSNSPVNETLTFTNDSESLNFLALDDYKFTQVPFQWREIENKYMPSIGHMMDPPFPLLFGGLDSSNGIKLPVDTGIYPRLHFSISDYLPHLETVPGSPVTVRNDWDDQIEFGQFLIDPLFSENYLRPPEIGANRSAKSEVLGAAPNREWIIEWSDYYFNDCPEANIGVQIVFFEQSPDVLVNYKNIDVNCAGKLPKLVVQYNLDSWVTYDQDLASATSVLLSPRHGSLNLAPVVDHQIPAQVLTHGQTLTLDLSTYFSDPDGDHLQYFLGRSQDYVTVSPSGLLTARFPAFPDTDIPLSTIQVVAYDGRQATRTNIDVRLNHSENFPPEQLSPIPDIFIPAGSLQIFDLNPYFRDVDLDPLEMTLLNQTFGGVRVLRDKGSLRLDTSSVNEGQQFNIKFLVSDGQYSIQSNVFVNITAGSDLPPQQFHTIPNQTVRVGEYLRIPLYKYLDPGSTHFFRYKQIQGPSTSDINIITETYNFVPTEQDLLDGPYLVQISRTPRRGQGETIATFNIEIMPANQPPIFTVSMPIILTPGSQLDLNLNTLINDPDGDHLSFVVGQLPEGLQQNSDTQITGSNMTEGQYSIPIRVTDDFGAGLVSKIEISVEQPSTEPPSSEGGGGLIDLFIAYSLILVALGKYSLNRNQLVLSNVQANL